MKISQSARQRNRSSRNSRTPAGRKTTFVRAPREVSFATVSAAPASCDGAIGSETDVILPDSKPPARPSPPKIIFACRGLASIGAAAPPPTRPAAFYRRQQQRLSQLPRSRDETAKRLPNRRP